MGDWVGTDDVGAVLGCCNSGNFMSTFTSASRSRSSGDCDCDACMILLLAASRSNISCLIWIGVCCVPPINLLVYFILVSGCWMYCTVLLVVNSRLCFPRSILSAILIVMISSTFPVYHRLMHDMCNCSNESSC